MCFRNIALAAALIFGTTAFAQTKNNCYCQDMPGKDWGKVAEPDAGESVLNITNTGAYGAPLLGPGLFGTNTATGNICVNVYAFDPDEELISCCSCLVTPDQTVSLGVNASLTSGTLTGVVPASVKLKLVATLPGVDGTSGTCVNSAANTTLNAANYQTVGVAAWGTTLRPTPTTAYATVETPLIDSTVSPGELASITGRCASIIGNASGHGICSSCRSGALGGQKL